MQSAVDRARQLASVEATLPEYRGAFGLFRGTHPTTVEVIAVFDVLDAIGRSERSAFFDRLEVVKTICNNLPGYVYMFYLSMFALHATSTDSATALDLRDILLRARPMGGPAYGSQSFETGATSWWETIRGATEALRQQISAGEHDGKVALVATVAATAAVMLYLHKRRGAAARTNDTRFDFHATMAVSLLEGTIREFAVPEYAHGRIEPFATVLGLVDVHMERAPDEIQHLSTTFRIYTARDEEVAA